MKTKLYMSFDNRIKSMLSGQRMINRPVGGLCGKTARIENQQTSADERGVDAFFGPRVNSEL